MMYEYVTFNDETMVCHSEIKEMNGEKYINIYFEKPIDDGFATA